VVGVGVVDAGRRDVVELLAVPRLRLGDVDDFQDLGTAEAGDLHGSHGRRLGDDGVGTEVGSACVWTAGDSLASSADVDRQGEQGQSRRRPRATAARPPRRRVMGGILSATDELDPRSDYWATDAGIDGGGASAEEVAIHVLPESIPSLGDATSPIAGTRGGAHDRALRRRRTPRLAAGASWSSVLRLRGNGSTKAPSTGSTTSQHVRPIQRRTERPCPLHVRPRDRSRASRSPQTGSRAVEQRCMRHCSR
jgi:hypothetical protein